LPTKRCLRCGKEMDYSEDCQCLIDLSKMIEAESDRRLRGQKKPKKGKATKNEDH